MRSSSRLFMAAILLTVAAGFASAQESSEPPPPPAPDAAVPVVPVVELPPIPVGVAAPVPDPNAPPVEPALTIDQSALPIEPVAVAPVAVAIVEQEKPAVTTNTKRVTKKTVKKPEEQLAVQPKESLDPAAAAAGTAAVDTNANMPPAPDAAANTAPAKSVAPPPPAAKSVVVETPAEGTEPQTSMGIGGWLLAGIVVVAMVGLITWFRRRRTQRKTSIVEFPQFSPELKPLPVSRF